MQDDPIKFATPDGGFIVREKAPQGQLPPTFIAELAQADAVLLISSDEAGGLCLRPIIKGGMYEPNDIATHALVGAIVESLDDLVQRAKGEITDAMRFDAQRQFAALAGADPARFETINTMLHQFDEDNPQAGKFPTIKELNRTADFIVHAVAETAPLAVEQPAVN